MAMVIMGSTALSTCGVAGVFIVPAILRDQYRKRAHLTEASAQDIALAIAKLQALQENVSREPYLSKVEEAIDSLEPLLTCQNKTWAGAWTGNVAVVQLLKLYKALQNYHASPLEHPIRAGLLDDTLQLLQAEENSSRGITGNLAGRVSTIPLIGPFFSSPKSLPHSPRHRAPLHPLKELLHQTIRSKLQGYELPHETMTRLRNLILKVEEYEPELFGELGVFVTQEMAKEEVAQQQLQGSMPYSLPDISFSGLSSSLPRSRTEGKEHFGDDKDDGIGAFSSFSTEEQRREDLIDEERNGIVPVDSVPLTRPAQKTPALRISLVPDLEKLRGVITTFLISKMPLQEGESRPAHVGSLRQENEIWKRLIDCSQKRVVDRLIAKIRTKKCENPDDFIANISLTIELCSINPATLGTLSEVILGWIDTASNWVGTISEPKPRKEILRLLRSYGNNIKQGHHVIETLKGLERLFEENDHLVKMLKNLSPKEKIQAKLSEIHRSSPKDVSKIRQDWEPKIKSKIEELTHTLPLYGLFHLFYIFLGHSDRNEAKKAYAEIMLKTNKLGKQFKKELLSQIYKSKSISTWRRYPLLALLGIDFLVPLAIPIVFVASVFHNIKIAGFKSLPHFIQHHPFIALSGISLFHSTPFITDTIHFIIESLTTPLIKDFIGFSHEVCLLPSHHPTQQYDKVPIDIVKRSLSSMIQVQRDYAEGSDPSPPKEAFQKSLSSKGKYYDNCTISFSSRNSLDQATVDQLMANFINPQPPTTKIKQLMGSTFNFAIARSNLVVKVLSILIVIIINTFLYLLKTLLSLVEIPVIFFIKKAILIPLLSHLQGISSVIEGGMSGLYGYKHRSQVDTFIIEQLDRILIKIKGSNRNKSEEEEENHAHLQEFQALIQHLFELTELGKQHTKSDLRKYFHQRGTVSSAIAKELNAVAPFAMQTYQQLLKEEFINEAMYKVLELGVDLLNPHVEKLTPHQKKQILEYNFLLQGEHIDKLSEQRTEAVLAQLLSKQEAQIEEQLQRIVDVIVRKVSTYVRQEIAMTPERAISHFIEWAEDRLFVRPVSEKEFSYNIFHNISSTLEILRNNSPTEKSTIIAMLHDQFLFLLSEFKEKQAQIDRFETPETRKTNRVSARMLDSLTVLYEASYKRINETVLTSETLSQIILECETCEKEFIAYGRELDSIKSLITQKEETNGRSTLDTAVATAKAGVEMLREPAEKMGKDHLTAFATQITYLVRDPLMTSHLIRHVCVEYLKRQGNLKST
ncbi:MAG: hypothetical protein HYZ47_01235 [Simkania negevensis]|nr:hypothetical protein [Simkania negevensis]